MEIKQLPSSMIPGILIYEGLLVFVWLKTSDLDAEIMSSGQFSILMSDGFIRVCYDWFVRYTEPFPVPQISGFI